MMEIWNGRRGHVGWQDAQGGGGGVPTNRTVLGNFHFTNKFNWSDSE